jgi:hypothetical protein
VLGKMNKYKNLTLPHDKQGVVVSSNQKNVKVKFGGNAEVSIMLKCGT